MAKKEKKQKTRFEDEQGSLISTPMQREPTTFADQATGWGQTTQNSWGIPVAQPGWGVQEESDYEEETTWSNPPAGWGAETGASHWTNWGHSQSAQNIEPKFRTTPPTPTTHASPDQSPIMNALFSNPNVEKTSPPHQYNTPTNQQSVQKFQQPSHRQTMHPQQYGTTPSQWGTTWDDIAEEDEDGLSYADEEYGHPQAQDGYFPTASPYPISPSRTLSNALGSPGGGIPFDTPPVDIDSHNHNFIESQGAALSRAHRALYNQERTAKERLHWSFSPEKDERISSLLKWIEGMSDGVAALGVSHQMVPVFLLIVVGQEIHRDSRAGCSICKRRLQTSSVTRRACF